VLQERAFERVGGTKVVNVDVRIVAATHRDLPQQVRDGKFREDLYYRLNVIPVMVPPLRERREDIRPLVEHFIQKHGGGRRSWRVGAEVIDALAAYDWPGNVRELENVVQRALVLATQDELTLEDFSLQFEARAPRAGVLPRDAAREQDIEHL